MTFEEWFQKEFWPIEKGETEYVVAVARLAYQAGYNEGYNDGSYDPRYQRKDLMPG